MSETFVKSRFSKARVTYIIIAVLELFSREIIFEVAISIYLVAISRDDVSSILIHSLVASMFRKFLVKTHIKKGMRMLFQKGFHSCVHNFISCSS